MEFGAKMDNLAAIKVQEKKLYAELIKYFELLTKQKEIFIQDFEDIANKAPGFHIVTVVEGMSTPLTFSSHILTPATLRQDNIEPIDMTVTAAYGLTSIAPALLGPRFETLLADVIDVSLEIKQMSSGVGHA